MREQLLESAQPQDFNSYVGIGRRHRAILGTGTNASDVIESLLV